MTHVAPMRMNEFVVIKRADDGTFQVEYGPKHPAAHRYVCSDFQNVDEAIAWVDRLDRSNANLAVGDATKVSAPSDLPPMPAL